MKIKYLVLSCLLVLLMSSCARKGKKSATWIYDKSIDLGKVAPIGVIPDGEHFWITDSDNNQVVQIDAKGAIVKAYQGFARPMHPTLVDGKLYVPEYTADTIKTLAAGKTGFLPILDQPDAPASVDILGDAIAVADFYNHRVIYQKGQEKLTFGEKGKSSGQFHYPTDVQFKHNKLYVADAYNHRIQIFDLTGKYLQTIGETEKMNATTGIFVDDRHIIATDFENNRLLIYDLEGKLLQIIDQHLNKPTDVFVKGDQLFVTNYKGKSLGVFRWGK